MYVYIVIVILVGTLCISIGYLCVLAYLQKFHKKNKKNAGNLSPIAYQLARGADLVICSYQQRKSRRDLSAAALAATQPDAPLMVAFL